jgi:hypothetical protein
VKIVGNMIELNRPIAITLHIASAPPLDIVVASNVIATSANRPSSRRASSVLSSADPTKRPIIAPPQ